MFKPKFPNYTVITRQGAEDDGFLLVYVRYEDEGVSKLHVYDAATMAATPLAVVALPARVPYGFHGTFVTEAQMKAQRTDGLM